MGPNSCVRTPLRYKREAFAVHRTSPDRHKLSQLSHSRGKAIQHTVDVGYYAPAARTTLNLAVLVVFLREIDLGPAIPRVHTLWVRAGAFRHPAVVAAPRQFPSLPRRLNHTCQNPGEGPLTTNSQRTRRRHTNRHPPSYHSQSSRSRFKVSLQIR